MGTTGVLDVVMVVTWIMHLSGLVAARTEILREKFAPLDVVTGVI
jgi:hypothetical protein